MEATAAAAIPAYTGKTSLARSLYDLVHVQKKVTGAEIARAVHYSRTSVSRYIAGLYESEELEVLLTAWHNEYTGKEQTASAPASAAVKAAAKKPGFYESRDARAVLGVCQSSQEYAGLGIVVGRSGYGKTHALKYYARLARVAYIECDDTMGSRDLVEAIEHSLGIPSGYGTIWKRVNGIREFCTVNKGYLIIIDEADKLISKFTQKKMEIIRAIFDQSTVGLVIAGEPKLEAQLKTYLDRMANRMDFYAMLRGLTGAEVESFLEGYNVEPDALAELKARACNTQNGCFRLLDRTLNNIFRILRERGSDTVTMKIIEQASGMMML